MRLVYGDLHIHIGYAGGRAIKVTASKKLQLYSIIFSDAPRKGLDMVGIVDAASPSVLAELQTLLAEGRLTEHSSGGFHAANGVMLIAGVEVETREGTHIIIYLPYIRSIEGYLKYMRSRVTNLELSTQRANAGLQELINLAYLLEGIICPAHAFTPHKGVYGCWTDSLLRMLGRDVRQIKTLELGLSADTDMADTIRECRDFTLLSNSDAHSPDNIGREYNLFRMQDKSFAELRLCLENRDGRRIIANYGMDPLMGKYHRSYCPGCGIISAGAPPVFSCSECGSNDLVAGVYDRIVAIRDYATAHHPVGRPPYYYRVPLKGLPGVGPKTIDKLMRFFPNEINILEKADLHTVERIAGDKTAQMINRMRTARLPIQPGGGGKYGRVMIED